MILNETEKLSKVKKMTEEPELCRLSITPDGNLHYEGNRRYVFTHYFVQSPRGSFWRIGDECYPSDHEESESIHLALLTEKKMLINLPLDNCCYISPKNPPQEEDFFLSLVIAPEFCEFVYVDSNTKAPLRLLVGADKAKQLIGLTVTISKFYNKSVGEHFLYSFEQQEARG